MGREANAPVLKYERPLRYGKLEEIRHVFREEPRSPPVLVSVGFVMAVVGVLPVLLGTVSAFLPSLLIQEMEE